eukprot:3934978-Rhodomonas_salina.2
MPPVCATSTIALLLSRRSLARSASLSQAPYLPPSPLVPSQTEGSPRVRLHLCRSRVRLCSFLPSRPPPPTKRPLTQAWSRRRPWTAVLHP